jgi:hypothetical protein
MHFESRLAKTCVSGLVIAVAYLLTACPDATAPELSVDPRIICPGGQVTLSWRAQGGGVELTQITQGGGSSTRPVSTFSGQQPFTLFQTTTFTMRVGTGWNRPATAETTVQVLARLDQGMVGRATCEGRNIRSSSSLTAILSSGLHSMVVTNVAIATPADRDVTVTYGGHMFTGRGSTNVFNGMNITLGNWSLSAPLLVNEDCPGTPSMDMTGRPPPLMRGVPPAALSINVSLACPPQTSAPGGSSGMAGGGQCGGMGQTCCSGSCNSGLECRSGTCQPGGTTGDRTCGGNSVGAATQTFLVGIRDPYGCGTTVSARANSREEAEDCVRTQLEGQTIVQLPAALESYPFAFDSPLGCDQRMIPAFSADDARGCAQALCPIDCTRIEFRGICPPPRP